jgi:hypothetical protein
MLEKPGGDRYTRKSTRRLNTWNQHRAAAAFAIAPPRVSKGYDDISGREMACTGVKWI